MEKAIKKNRFIALAVTLMVMVGFSACSDISGTDYNNDIASEQFTQSFDKKVNITGNALDDKGKVYVCKFTRTPGTDRVELKRGNQGLVHVSANSLRNVGLNNWPEVNIGDAWTDAHGRKGKKNGTNFSIVIDPILGAEALDNRDTEYAIEELCFGALEEEEEDDDTGTGVIGGDGER